MKKLALISLAGLMVSISSYSAFAEDTESLSPQDQAYEHCEIRANDDESGQDWDAVFSACMQEQGFDNQDDANADIPDEPYVDDNYL